VASIETGLEIWTAPDDLQEMLLGAWAERRKNAAQKALEADVTAALSKR
jgi:hypothetical protein